MYCPNCGAPNESGAEKCVNCAKPLPKVSPDGDLQPNEWPTPASVPSAPGEPPRPNYYPGQPGSQYSYGYGPPPGPTYGGTYPQYPPTAYYDYSIPADRVGVAAGEAGFWSRLGAYLIDSIIVSIITGIVFILPLIFWMVGFFSRYQDQLLPVCDSSNRGYDSERCSDIMGNLLSRSDELGPFLGLIFGLGGLATLLALLYYVILTARGATLGKKVFGLKVVTREGLSPGIGRALLRQIVGYTVSSFFYLGFIWIAFDPHKQGWHDKIAGTYVIVAV
jgi:uncharacterized RDD family membrane protein YckC